MIKSISLNQDDLFRINKIIDKKTALNGVSEVLKFSYEEAARKIPDWHRVIEMSNKQKLIKEDAIEELNIKKATTFNIDDGTFNAVYKSVTDDLQYLTRPRISYITRLCVNALYLQILEEMKNEKVVEVASVEALKIVEAVNLKLFELLRNNKSKKLRELSILLELEEVTYEEYQDD